MKTTFFISLLVVLSSFTAVNAQWVQTNGPGDRIESLTSTQNYLFAGTWSNGVFRTGDFGNNWVSCGLISAAPILALASNGNTVFAGSIYSAVYRSTDYGNSWAVSLGPGDAAGNPSINCIRVSNNIIYVGKRRAGADNRAFLYSTNNGQSWINVSTGIYAVEVLSIAAIGSNVFAGTLDGQSGVYLTTNNGLNWSPKGLPNVFALEAIGNNLFAGALQNGVFLSTDFGTSWTFLSSGLPLESRVYRLVSYGGNLFAGTYESGVYLSTNLGQSWTAINSGLGDLHIYSLNIMEPFIFAGTANFVWKRNLQEITSSNINHGEVPKEFRIYQNYPNPFNPVTTIKYSIPQTYNGKVSVNLSVFNILGETVSTLVDEDQNPGEYEVSFNGADLASGMYFYRLRAGDEFSDVKKMMLIK